MAWAETSRSGPRKRGQHELAITIVGVMLPADVGVATALPTVGKLMNAQSGVSNWTTSPTTTTHARDYYIVQNTRLDRSSQAGRVFTYSTATALKAP